jgi:hypothetical protein
MPSGSFRALQKVALVVSTGCLLSTTAVAAGTAYHWVTEDGTYAFTDDPKAIPARYRDQVQVRTLKSLRDYPRFTPVKTQPSIARAEEPAGPAAGAPLAAACTPVATAGAASMGPTVSLRTGDVYSPIVDVTPGTSFEPVVIEKRRFRPERSIATRSDTIVSQGDRVLTIIKPHLNESDVTDLGDEGDL